MKPRAPSFGHAEMDYRLNPIFRKAALAFDDADHELTRLEKEYKKTDSELSVLKPLFEASERRREAGTILLFSAVAYLEQALYIYAVGFLDPESYEEHLGRTRFVSKWILVPRVCQNILIQESDPAINALKELVAARNSIIHPKRHVMYNPAVTNRRLEKEERRFISACRAAEQTVSSTLALLTKKNS